MITEQTRICKEYIENKIGMQLEYDQLNFHDLKDKLGIKDIDLYNTIAKSLGVHELRQVRNTLLYTFKVPDDNKNLWYVALVGDNLVKFKQKYGKDYKIG